MKQRIIEFTLTMIIYAVLLYLAVAWIAWEIDIRWWWDWQRAIWITAMICYASCIWTRTKQ